MIRDIKLQTTEDETSLFRLRLQEFVTKGKRLLRQLKAVEGKVKMTPKRRNGQLHSYVLTRREDTDGRIDDALWAEFADAWDSWQAEAGTIAQEAKEQVERLEHDVKYLGSRVKEIGDSASIESFRDSLSVVDKSFQEFQLGYAEAMQVHADIIRYVSSVYGSPADARTLNQDRQTT